MKCEDIIKLLSAYLDEEVNPGERKFIEAHLLTCEKCTDELRLLDSTREELRQALKARSAGIEPSAQTWDRVRQRITSKPHFGDHLSDILNSPTWRRAIPITLAIIVVGVLWGTGVLPRLVGFVPASTPPAITFAPGPSVSASYVSSFQDMDELCNSSDVIVVGTVGKVIDVVPAESGHGTIYDARSTFRIDQVLKGKIDKEIVLTKMAFKVTGGWAEGMNVDPPFEAGEKWVLFLSADISYNNLGPWGRYKIIDNKVYSMNRIANDNNVYGGGEPDFKLDFNGVLLEDFIAGVNKTLDSVVLTFTDSRIAWAIDRAVRFDAGGFQEVNVNLSTGKYGPDSLTYTLKRVDSKDSAVEVPMPDGLDITIQPAQFAANPRNEYQSTLKIQTTPDLSPGTYWIRVEYQFGKSTSGYRAIMVNINP